MVKTSSKTTKNSKTPKAVQAPSLAGRDSSSAHRHPINKPKFFHRIKIKIKTAYTKLQTARAKHVHLHKSFRRSYREDYQRPLHTPGLLAHAALAFQTLFKHWKTFIPLILLMVLCYILGVGLLDASVYQSIRDSIDEAGVEVAGGDIGNFTKAGLVLLSTITSGGLDSGMGESQTLITILLFLIMWLVTVFLLRRFLAGEHPKLRDGLYNALGPLLSTLVVFVVIFIQAIPIMLVIIAYSAALATDFLSTPFYALLFFIFASLMILLSGYLISSSIMALVAVTAPGMYPLKAIAAASDLMAGRRIKFIIRLFYLIVVVVLCFIVVMLPTILLDFWLKSIWEYFANVPFVQFWLLFMTCFTFVYASIYIYLYYRWLLDNEEENESKRS